MNFFTPSIHGVSGCARAFKRRAAKKRRLARREAKERVAERLHGGREARGQQQPYERLSVLIGRDIGEHGGVTIAEAFELVMRWKERHPSVSKTAATKLWDLLGVFMCPDGISWPHLQTLTYDIREVAGIEGFVKLQVCRNQCREGLYWKDRSGLEACQTCRRPRTDALTFFHRK